MYNKYVFYIWEISCLSSTFLVCKASLKVSHTCLTTCLLVPERRARGHNALGSVLVSYIRTIASRIIEQALVSERFVQRLFAEFLIAYCFQLDKSRDGARLAQVLVCFVIDLLLLYVVHVVTWVGRLHLILYDLFDQLVANRPRPIVFEWILRHFVRLVAEYHELLQVFR